MSVHSAALCETPYHHTRLMPALRYRDGHIAGPGVPVAVIAAYGRLESAGRALKQGAFDVVFKPLDLFVLRLRGTIRAFSKGAPPDGWRVSRLPEWPPAAHSQARVFSR